MEVKEYSTLEIKDAAWQHVTMCLAGFNSFQSEDDGEERTQEEWREREDAFQKQQIMAALLESPATRSRDDLDLVTRDVILVADHSVGDREVRFADEKISQPYIRDPHFSGGWHVATAETVTRLEFGSASSGSRILAIRRGNRWDITGTFPIIGGERYEGAYFKSFMEASRIPLAGDAQREELKAIRQARKERENALWIKVNESVVPTLESFRGWDLITPEYATPAEIAEAAEILRGLGWETVVSTVYGYGKPAKALATRPGGGWGDEEQLERLAGCGWWDYPYGPQPADAIPLFTVQ